MMKHTTSMAKLLLFAAGLFLLGSCQQAQQDSSTTPTEETATSIETKGQSAVQDPDSKPNILQIAINSKDHSTLVAAVQAAGLEDVLVNAGPLTVFAPNNAAFDKLPEGTLEELTKPENKEKLAGIIKFHASPGKYTENMLKDGMRLFQASGHYVKVERKDDGIYVNGSKLLGSVPASNGIVYVIEDVWLPPEE